MRAVRFPLLASLLLALTTAGMSPAHAAGEEEQIRSRLQQAVPDAKVVAVRASAMPGLYEVELPGGMVYASADGQFVIQGDLLQLKGKQVVNLSEQSMATRRISLLKSVDRRDAIIFPARGKPKAVLTVFTDVDCGYCRKLHQEVPAMNKLGIEIRYLAFPRDLPRYGVNGGAGKQMAQIWCSGNREKAMTLAKQGEAAPAAVKGCKAPILAQYTLGQRMGVKGTPAIFNEKGEQLGGYITVEQAVQLLGLK